MTLDGSTGEYQWYALGITGTFRMEVTYPTANGVVPSATNLVQGSALAVASATDVYTGNTIHNPGDVVPVGATEFGNTDYLSNYDAMGCGFNSRTPNLDYNILLGYLCDRGRITKYHR